MFFVEFCFGACQLCVNETFKNTAKAILEHSFEPPLIFTDLVSKERKHELYIGKLYSISQRGSQSYSKWFDDLNESTVHRIQEWMHNLFLFPALLYHQVLGLLTFPPGVQVFLTARITQSVALFLPSQIMEPPMETCWAPSGLDRIRLWTDLAQLSWLHYEQNTLPNKKNPSAETVSLWDCWKSKIIRKCLNDFNT